MGAGVSVIHSESSGFRILFKAVGEAGIANQKHKSKELLLGFYPNVVSLYAAAVFGRKINRAVNVVYLLFALRTHLVLVSLGLD